ncbi:hypothetical protein MUK42_14059 [Musa troglodytarum]|uniref:Uncharacterized protein n=1 Tax=Musa troglodytarum TaxID=320322 RepID=A0A9E7L706_9LILI|nr:hypothetical protein MUK42_14059 [Musa troglodytarum]
MLNDDERNILLGLTGLLMIIFSILSFSLSHHFRLQQCGDLPLTVAIGVHLMDLIDGVNQVQGDITNVRTAEVLKCFHFHRKISRGSKEFLSALLMGDHNSEDNGRLDR